MGTQHLSLKFAGSVSVGDVITFVSILLAALGLTYTIHQDRALRRREYADRIRDAAAKTTVGLERWKQLSLQLYDDLQGLITRIDVTLVESQDKIKARDALWQGIVGAASASRRRVSDERIEIAYSDLYGYNPRIQALFSNVTATLRAIDSEALARLLENSQENVLKLDGDKYYSAQLGNELRATVQSVAQRHAQELERAITPLRQALLTLIDETDRMLIGGHHALGAGTSDVLGPRRRSRRTVATRWHGD